MDKKFMKIKKFIIPVMTIIVMTSQLMGCASVSSNEMLELLQAGESIEIEVAMPSYYEEEQGEEILASWTELGLLETNKDFRLAFDDATYTHSAGDVGKNGPMYIDLDGNWTNNSTLHYAMMNKTFVEKYWNDNATKDSLREAILEAYVDIDENDSEKVRDAVIINAYFNLFNDHEEAYANPNSTLTRGEFLAGLAKADTPVDKELANSPEFLSCIGEQTDLTLIAELADAHSYLNSKDKSLDAVTFNGTISKAEAVYTVVQRYFGEEFSKVTGKEEAYADTKNAGNIALRAKFINEKENRYPDKWKAYTLSSMLQNPEKGMDEEFYKAYVVAKQHNLLPSGVTDSNWDEAITKAEAIDLILKSYEAIAKRDGYATNQQDGLNEGSVVGRGDSTSVDSETTNTADVEIDGEILEDTGITEEEFEEFKATATGALKNNIAKYEAIKANGSWTSENGTVYDKVVGTPGDTSWRKMTDEQAQQILATADPSSSEYFSAKAELEGANWSKIDAETGTVYFDYYEYKAMAQAQVQERLNSAEQKIIDNAIMDREQNPEEWDEMMGGDIKN